MWCPRAVALTPKKFCNWPLALGIFQCLPPLQWSSVWWRWPVHLVAWARGLRPLPMLVVLCMWLILLRRSTSWAINLCKSMAKGSARWASRPCGAHLSVTEAMTIGRRDWARWASRRARNWCGSQMRRAQHCRLGRLEKFWCVAAS